MKKALYLALAFGLLFFVNCGGDDIDPNCWDFVVSTEVSIDYPEFTNYKHVSDTTITECGLTEEQANKVVKELTTERVYEKIKMRISAIKIKK